MQCQDCTLQSTELSRTLNFWKTGHMLSILALSPLSNAPTCPLHTSCFCTIVELLGHDHGRQRGESCVSMGGTHICPVVKQWTCFPETTPNLSYFITHLSLWKKNKSKTSPRPCSQSNVFNSQISVVSHLPPGSLHSKKTFVHHKVLKWCCSTFISSL